MKLLSIVSWLVALAVSGTTRAEVGQNFNGCLRFFYGNTPPQGFEQVYGPNEISYVCQIYDGYNNPLFASLYHRVGHHPLYSAYILDVRPGDRTGDDQTFRLEPQLVNSGLPREISLQPATEAAIRNNHLPGVPSDLIRQSQAVNADYQNSGYDRGHLNPNADHPEGVGQKATYTLTNVVPMRGALNRGDWRMSELRVRNIAASCATMYVVTGIIPGNNWINVSGQNRVRIPSHVWSAYCCRRTNQPPLSGGALAQNDVNNVTTYTLQNLEAQLTKLIRQATNVNANVQLFQNNCQ